MDASSTETSVAPGAAGDHPRVQHPGQREVVHVDVAACALGRNIRARQR
jgi:hypothetical protein